MINIQYKDKNQEFPQFYKSIKDRAVLVICDINTQPFAVKYQEAISAATNGKLDILTFKDKQLVPDTKACQAIRARAAGNDYILAVGSGTLNDLAKHISTESGKDCGVLATAPSMDGYASKNAAYIQDGKKLASVTNAPKDILIDLDIICDAPKQMISAGAGDILGKFTSLADWQLGNILNDEPINPKAFDMMQKALNQYMDNFQGVVNHTPDGIAALMNALIVSGLAMAENGDSRPASGSEHHMSHFLEMHGLQANREYAPHGIQVGIGTLASLTIYKNLHRNSDIVTQKEGMTRLIDGLPQVSFIRELLQKVGAPTRLSQIGVDKQTALEMLKKAHTVRTRFTILTLVDKLRITDNIIPAVMAECF